MKTNQKPDLLIVLATCVALGVCISMYTQRALYQHPVPATDQSSTTTIKQATPNESHPLDPSTLVKVNETLQREQHRNDKPLKKDNQTQVYQF